MSAILIVDPEHEEFLSSTLALEGYTIYTAPSVVTPHITKNIGLVILDAGYFGNRIAECEFLQRHREGRGIPIIVISVLGHLSKQAFKAGATAFLEKPFEMSTLLKTVESLLDHR